MNDRPKRERRPTTFFHYRDTPAESIIANFGSTPPKRNTTSRAKIKKEDIESPDKNASPTRGGSRGRKRGSGARGRAGSESTGASRSRRRNNSTDVAGQSEDAPSTISSNPTEDAGAPIDENDDPEIDENGNNVSISPATRFQKDFRAPSGRKLSATRVVISRLPTESDEVIEQWYADPYERVNPNDFAYDQWRLRNLQFSLQNQGYSIVNSKQMAAWLMKCNGNFKEFGAPPRKSRAKKSRQTTIETDGRAMSTNVVSDGEVQQEVDDDGDEDEQSMGGRSMESSQQASKQSEAAANFAAFKNAISPKRLGSESSIQESDADTVIKTESVASD